MNQIRENHTLKEVRIKKITKEKTVIKFNHGKPDVEKTKKKQVIKKSNNTNHVK